MIHIAQPKLIILSDALSFLPNFLLRLKMSKFDTLEENACFHLFSHKVLTDVFFLFSQWSIRHSSVIIYFIGNENSNNPLLSDCSENVQLGFASFLLTSKFNSHPSTVPVLWLVFDFPSIQISRKLFQFAILHLKNRQSMFDGFFPDSPFSPLVQLSSLHYSIWWILNVSKFKIDFWHFAS